MTSSSANLESSIKLSQVKDAKETFQAVLELSKLLGTGLDPEALSICVRLCEAGINPQTLALVVKELQKEVGRYHDASLQEHE